MIIVINAALASILFYGYLSKNKKYSEIIFCFGILLLFFITAFRNTGIAGTDARAYARYFREYVGTLSEFNFQFWNYSDPMYYGWGFALLNTVCKTLFGSNIFSVQLVCAILSFLLFINNIHKLKWDGSQKCLFLFIYFCYEFYWYFLVLLRQNVANQLVWSALINIYLLSLTEPSRRKEWLVFVLGMAEIAVAYLFHPTAVLFFLLYPILFFLKKVIIPNPVLVILLAASAAMFFWGEIFIPKLVDIFSLAAGEQFSSFRDLAFGGFNPINYLFHMAILLFMVFGNKKQSPALNNIALMAVLLSSFNIEIGVRIVEYAAIGYYIGLVITTDNTIVAPKYRILFLSGIFAFFMTLLIRFVYVNAPWLLEYSFVWNQ